MRNRAGLRLMLTWGLLAASYLAGSALFSFFHSGNWQPETEFYAYLAIVPVFQALLLECRSESNGISSTVSWSQQVLRRFPWLVPLLIADFVLLYATFIGGEEWVPRIGSGALMDSYCSIKALALGAAMLIQGRWGKPVWRTDLIVLGAASLVFGLQRLTHGLPQIPAYSVIGALAALAWWRLQARSNSDFADAARAFRSAGLWFLPAGLIGATEWLRPGTVQDVWALLVSGLLLPALSAGFLGLACLKLRQRTLS